MESISRLNILQEKISNLLQVASKLKAENDYLTEENSLLKEEAAELKDKLKAVQDNTAQYLSERDAIKERVERLIEMID